MAISKQEEARRREIVASYEGCGLTHKEYAKSRRISESSLYRWTSQYTNQKKSVRFARVIQDEHPEQPGISIQIGKASISLQPGFDQATLAAVIELLTQKAQRHTAT